MLEATDDVTVQRATPIHAFQRSGRRRQQRWRRRIVVGGDRCLDQVGEQRALLQRQVSRTERICSRQRVGPIRLGTLMDVGCDHRSGPVLPTIPAYGLTDFGLYDMAADEFVDVVLVGAERG